MMTEQKCEVFVEILQILVENLHLGVEKVTRRKNDALKFQFAFLNF